MADYIVSDTLTLSDAIAAANASDGADVIRFAPGLTEVLLLAPVAIEAAGDLVIDGDADGDGVSDVVVTAQFGHHFTIAPDAEVTIRNIDLTTAFRPGVPGALSGESGNAGEDATRGPVSGLDGGDGGDASDGTDGEDGEDGIDKAGAIVNDGTLVLERVGLSGNYGYGQPGGSGGSGGKGGDARGGEGGSDRDPHDTPRAEPRFEVNVIREFDGFQDAIIETIVDWTTLINTSSTPVAGGDGGDGGRGGNGGAGGDAGDGGHGAGAILNRGDLTLTDVVFSGRLSGGGYGDGNTSWGGPGGFGGRGGNGGETDGGYAGDAGVEWSRVEAVRYAGEDGEDYGTFFRYYATGLPGTGGNGGRGGQGGDAGDAGNAGAAATIINLGSIEGLGAGTAGTVTQAAARTAPSGGLGGSAQAGIGGVGYQPWHELGSTKGGPPADPNSAALQTLAELNATARAFGQSAPIPSGEAGPSGAPGIAGSDGRAGRSGEPGLSADGILNLSDGSEMALAESLTYIHALPDDGSGALRFNVIRIGDTSEAATVSWRVVGDDEDPVEAADFGSAEMPGGGIVLGAATAEADGPDPNVRTISLAPMPRDGTAPAEGYRIELFDAQDTTLGTSVLTGTLGEPGDGPIEGGPIEGGTGPDPLEGTTEDDVILGLGGNDTLTGFGGDDLLDGGTGRDRMEGGTGDDTYVVDDRGDTVVEAAGEGFDLVRATAHVTLRRAEVERVELEGSGAHRVVGNGHATEMVGNDAANILAGGGGGDVLTGGGGADIFAFLTSDAPGGARVTDFSEGDRFALDDRFFGLGDGAIETRDVTMTQMTAALRSGLARYDGRTGELWIDTDGRGGPDEARLVVTLDGGGPLTVDDLLLF